MKRSMLIVYPEAFALGWRGAATRLFDLAAGLDALGWQVSMLSAPSSLSQSQHYQEECFAGRIIRTPFTGAYPRWVESHPAFRRIWRGLWKVRGKDHYYYQLGVGWAARVQGWVSECWSGPAPDLIWAICTSNMNGIVAGPILAEHFSRPVVLEFQDPPSSKDNRLHQCLEELFRRVVLDCNGIVTTSLSYARHLVSTYRLSEAMILPLPLSFSATNRSDSMRVRDGRLVLLHAGSLKTDSRRNARSLVSSLELVYRSEPESRGQIVLHLVGGGEGALQAKSVAKAYGIGDAVQVTEEVSLPQAQAAMNNADVLVVIKHSDPVFDMQIPGKLFQYLPAGKPILGIMPPQTEAADILRSSGLGFISANDDIPRTAGNLRRFWKARNQLQDLCAPNLEFIAQFSREATAQRCHHFLLGVLEKGRDRRMAIGAEESSSSREKAA